MGYLLIPGIGQAGRKASAKPSDATMGGFDSSFWMGSRAMAETG